jgi:hypothetical protein
VAGSTRSNIAILGAGIMGCCVALELARRGFKVDLIDRAAGPMTAASLHNEGKLHLGFVYAKDPDKKTHRLMALGSLSFARIIEKLTGTQPCDLAPSMPFHYFVPVDSQLPVSAIEQHFYEVERTIVDLSRATGDRYLNIETERFFARNSDADHSRMFAPDVTAGSFSTQERSVSPTTVAHALERAIAHQPNVNFIGNTKVLSIERLPSGDITVEFARNGETTARTWACVANCSWDSKMWLDRAAGLVEDGPWLLRYKATITIATGASLPQDTLSATGILGPYGDLVSWSDGSYYISWYPLCRLTQTTNMDPNKLYALVQLQAKSRDLQITLPGLTASGGSSLSEEAFVRMNISAMAAFVPSMARLLDHAAACRIGGGVILARGATDIEDPESCLHQRIAVGPVAHGSYVSINTGKYCTAPWFSLAAADMIADVLQ